MKRFVITIFAILLSVGSTNLLAQGSLFKQLGKFVEKEVVSGVKKGVKQGINNLKNESSQPQAQSEKQQSEQPLSAPSQLFVQTTLPQVTPPSKVYQYDASVPTTGKHFNYYWVCRRV